jgi:hypothetical protein
MDYELLGKILAGFGVTMVALAAVLNRLGLLHLGKARCPAGGDEEDPPESCPDPSCKNELIGRLEGIKKSHIDLRMKVVQMDERQVEMKTQQEKQWTVLEEVRGTANWIKGFLQTKV